MSLMGGVAPPSNDGGSTFHTVGSTRSTSSEWLGGNFWPLMATVAILLTGMAYSFWWSSLYYHLYGWITPPDLWSTFRDAHWVGWGSEGAIYDANTSLVTFPGIAVLLTPLALLQNPLHLTASLPIYLARPTEWYLLGPVDLLLGGFVLFALNVLAVRLEISARRRILLVWVEAVLVWPVVVVWGHPEDTIAVAFAVYALVAVYDHKWLHVGFFLGLAVAFQPLVLLMIPAMFALIPLRRWPLIVGETALPSTVLLVGPLIHEWGPTTRTLIQQPNFPKLNYPTPWLALAPKLPSYRYATSYKFHELTLSNGTKAYGATPRKLLSGAVVAAGPERDISLVLAILLGIYLFRRRPSWPRLIWWMGVALSLRCAFESVLDPFYFFPGIALLLVASFTTTWRKISLTLFLSAACTKLSYWHTGEWTYYVLVIGALALACASAFPDSMRDVRRTEGDTEGHVTLENRI